MIYKKVDSKKYREEFDKKFSNFGDKAPIVISVMPDEFGVTIVHENSGSRYFYEWDYTIPVKAFIHKIKQDLSHNHYPRICRKEIVPISADKAAEMMANGVFANELPKTMEVVKTYRIDKILALKDEFILIDEETGDQFCYRMTSSSIYFLKNYSENNYSDIYEAGEEFFKKSVLVSQLNNIRD